MASDIRIDLGTGAPPAAETAAATRPTVRWQTPAPPPDYVVEVGRLFDGVRGTYHRHVDLHVRGGRIAAIVGRGVLPPVGEVIDARDATVIPGLIDLHAHQSSLVGERLGRAWLAYGVTTVRELTTSTGEAVERAEAWASGRSPGPRLLVSPAGTSSAADNLAPALRAYPGIAHGCAHSLRRHAREIPVPPWELARLPPRLRSRRRDAEPRARAFPRVHGVPRRLQPTHRRRDHVRHGPRGARRATRLANAAAAPRRCLLAVHSGASKRLGNGPTRSARRFPALERTIARLVRAGGRVGVGSDAPAVPYGLGVHLEFALLARAGIANDQVLRMATAGGALALGLEREIGTLEEGKLADFVVIDGDPLTHIADTSAIVAVAKGGVWQERSSLLTHRDCQAPLRGRRSFAAHVGAPKFCATIRNSRLRTATHSPREHDALTALSAGLYRNAAAYRSWATMQDSISPLFLLVFRPVACVLLYKGRPHPGTSECADEQKTMRNRKGFC